MFVFAYCKSKFDQPERIIFVFCALEREGLTLDEVSVVETDQLFAQVLFHNREALEKLLHLT